MDYSRLSAHIMQAKYHVVMLNNGVALQAVRRIRQGNHTRGKRGDVKGFSSASCRRLRHLLFKVDYSNAVAVTLTRPNSLDADFFGLRSPEVAFDGLNKDASRLSFVRSLIWRKEVQENGMPHYHCILIPSDGVNPLEAGHMLVDAWMKKLFMDVRKDSSFFQEEVKGGIPCKVIDCYCLERLRTLENKVRKAHNDKRRPAIRTFDDTSGFVRYVLDHQSKHKDYQAKTTGRAWGVWNRSSLPLLPFDFEDLTADEFYRLGRCLRKVTRYRVNDKRAVFGWYHTSGRRVQGHGITDYFGKLIDGSLAAPIKAYLALLRSGD